MVQIFIATKILFMCVIFTVFRVSRWRWTHLILISLGLVGIITPHPFRTIQLSSIQSHCWKGKRLPESLSILHCRCRSWTNCHFPFHGNLDMKNHHHHSWRWRMYWIDCIGPKLSTRWFERPYRWTVLVAILMERIVYKISHSFIEPS